MFSSAGLASLQTIAAQLDPNGKVSPYLDAGLQAVANRVSPTTPGIPNSPRSVEPSISRGAAVGQLGAVWAWLVERPIILAGGVLAVVAGVVYLLRR